MGNVVNGMEMISGSLSLSLSLSPAQENKTFRYIFFCDIAIEVRGRRMNGLYGNLD
jgi:hypothetical protein